ncbi:TonB C-terminal domain-containing protein [Chenggangzhangella methanolivorans]|uniref:TonB C-terminal domain-containing protein n=1 Tax=Chenggangzhangella methanolivorans TaxID=1437009 RepID=A0A9E6R8L9_9HYPH|nr:TonB C-terminal domain-containing protein [Chenggangzhangella methanolivorans]QZN99324.1 TonB C-terminal domain-containing protein [Chenggangzhangella methanolivorans]
MFARSLLALSLTLAVASPAPAEPEKPPLPQNRQEWAVAARLTFAGARPLPDSVKGVAGSLRTVVRIEIRRDGSIADVRIEKSSGFGPADEAALKMARDAGSLPPLPADIPGETHAATLPSS